MMNGPFPFGSPPPGWASRQIDFWWHGGDRDWIDYFELDRPMYHSETEPDDSYLDAGEEGPY